MRKGYYPLICIFEAASSKFSQCLDVGERTAPLETSRWKVPRRCRLAEQSRIVSENSGQTSSSATCAEMAAKKVRKILIQMLHLKFMGPPALAEDRHYAAEERLLGTSRMSIRAQSMTFYSSYLQKPVSVKSSTRRGWLKHKHFLFSVGRVILGDRIG